MIKKIIHIDMDYFFAQVEIRDNPALKGHPVAIGSPSGRGVLCTCNYVARKYGLRSAMPSFRAKELCPDVVFIKPNFKKYKEASNIIFDIFSEYTDLVEGISIDEAYLDVTTSERCLNSATLMAKEIREKIFAQTGLTASAGVSFNKLLAKISSEQNKPNGLFVLPPAKTQAFVSQVPISKMWGVGKVTENKLMNLGIKTFGDLQSFSKLDLINMFGHHGALLYNYARGIDYRAVEPVRERKSLSVENTFSYNIETLDDLKLKLFDAYSRMQGRLQKYNDRVIKSNFVKIKYADFSKTTIETQFNGDLSFESFFNLCLTRVKTSFPPIRLLGTGVRFFSQRTNGQLWLPLNEFDSKLIVD